MFADSAAVEKPLDSAGKPPAPPRPARDDDSDYEDEDDSAGSEAESTASANSNRWRHVPPRVSALVVPHPRSRVHSDPENLICLELGK